MKVEVFYIPDPPGQFTAGWFALEMSWDGSVYAETNISEYMGLREVYANRKEVLVDGRPVALNCPPQLKGNGWDLVDYIWFRCGWWNAQRLCREQPAG